MNSRLSIYNKDKGFLSVTRLLSSQSLKNEYKWGNGIHDVYIKIRYHKKKKWRMNHFLQNYLFLTDYFIVLKNYKLCD